MEERLTFIFSALEDAGIGLATATKLFTDAEGNQPVSRPTLYKWRDRVAPPKSEYTVKVVYQWAQLIRKAVDAGLLPLHPDISRGERLGAIRRVLISVRQMK